MQFCIHFCVVSTFVSPVKASSTIVVEPYSFVMAFVIRFTYYVLMPLISNSWQFEWIGMVSVVLCLDLYCTNLQVTVRYTIKTEHTYHKNWTHLPQKLNTLTTKTECTCSLVIFLLYHHTLDKHSIKLRCRWFVMYWALTMVYWKCVGIVYWNCIGNMYSLIQKKKILTNLP